MIKIINLYRRVAQWIEQSTTNRWVAGSSPAAKVILGNLLLVLELFSRRDWNKVQSLNVPIFA